MPKGHHRRMGDNRRTPKDHHNNVLTVPDAKHAPPSAGGRQWGSSFDHYKFEGGKHIEGGDIDLMSSFNPLYGAGLGKDCVTYHGEQRAGALPKRWVEKEKKTLSSRHEIPPPAKPKRELSSWIYAELQDASRQGTRQPTPQGTNKSGKPQKHSQMQWAMLESQRKSAEEVMAAQVRESNRRTVAEIGAHNRGCNLPGMVMLLDTPTEIYSDVATRCLQQGATIKHVTGCMVPQPTNCYMRVGGLLEQMQQTGGRGAGNWLNSHSTTTKQYTVGAPDFGTNGLGCRGGGGKLPLVRAQGSNFSTSHFPQDRNGTHNQHVNTFG